METKILILAFLWFVRIIRLKCIWGWYNKRCDYDDEYREKFTNQTTQIMVNNWSAAAFYFMAAVVVKYLLSPLPSQLEIIIGLTFYVAGFTVSSFGRVNLGSSWADHFAVNKNLCPLVTSGIYSFTRNPIYLGFYISQLGCGIALGLTNLELNSNSLNLPFGLLALYIYVNYIIANTKEVKGEEGCLASKYGYSYQLYCKNVGRYIPSIKGIRRIGKQSKIVFEKRFSQHHFN